MAEEKNDLRAGGSLLAIAIIAGAVGGTVVGQPSIGFLVGLATGLILLGAVWLSDRKGRR